MFKIGFIGSGKMAGAIIKGLLKSDFIDAKDLMATQLEKEGLDEKSQKLGIKILTDNKVLTKDCDIIFLAIKPSQTLGVLEEIKPYINDKKLIVSIVAGFTTSKIEANIPENSKVIRVMPNTPALLGEGMSGIVSGKHATSEDLEYIIKLFNTIGKTITVENEEQMDIVTAISGSGPAFFYKVINDIALAGKELGLDYEKSLLLSIQTALGSAKMALNREISMEELISNVATKGGCTRVGVDVMEELDTEKTFLNVIKKTAQKACELGK